MALSNLLINSDYPLDKIVYKKTDSMVVSPGFNQYKIPHGLLFTPLLKAVWSTDQSFAVTYNVGDGTPSTNPSAVFIVQVADVYSDGTYAYLTIIVNDTVPYTVYFNIWGYMPANVNVEAPTTADSADNFTFNSDYNYSKLLMSGVTPSSTTLGSTEVAFHNLGYLPQYDVWSSRDGLTYNISYSQILSGSPDTTGAIMQTDRLVMCRTNYSVTSPEYFHYRIYTDPI